MMAESFQNPFLQRVFMVGKLFPVACPSPLVVGCSSNILAKVLRPS